MPASSAPRSTPRPRSRRPRRRRRRRQPMFDLGRTFLASVERGPQALAIVDGATRLTYAAWLTEIGRVQRGLARLGLKHGDHLLAVLQNRVEMATLHWACQFAGV